jgi:hypothetical protein
MSSSFRINQFQQTAKDARSWLYFITGVRLERDGAQALHIEL